MKKSTKKINNSKSTKNNSKFFWKRKEDTSGYNLVDRDGSFVRVLPTLDVSDEELKLFGSMPTTFQVQADGKKHFWRPGVMDLETITAPVWGKEEKTYTGNAFTEVTVVEANSYVEELSKRLKKIKKQKEKRTVKEQFDKFFNESSYDEISIFWMPEAHPEFSNWEQFLNNSEYAWYMHKDTGHEMCEEAKGYWGIILKKDALAEVTEGELHIMMSDHVMTKVKDKSFIGNFKHTFGLNFVVIHEVS